MATRSNKSSAASATRKTKAAAKRVVPKKEAGGRPPKYAPKFHDPLARRLTLLGQTMSQMAEVFDVAESTIWDWKKRHAGFSEAITCARADADGLVAESLFNSAIGQRFTETKIRTFVGKNGEELIEKTVSERVIPGDVGAQKHWLHNRQPTLWKNIPADNDGDKLPEITSIVFQAVDGSITETTPGAEEISASEDIPGNEAPPASGAPNA